MDKTVPLVVYEKGKRIVVGEATVAADGTITGQVIDGDYSSELIDELRKINIGEFSIGFGNMT